MENKGNDGKGNIPERDLWETKQELWDKLDNQYNFSIDCCANLDNKKCDIFFYDFEKEDNLDGYVCWMNPPFSNARKMFEHFFKVVIKGVAIYRFDNPETKIWQEIIFPNCSWVFIPKSRVSYTPFDVGNMRKGRGTRFSSALIGFNVPPPKDIEGIIIEVKPNSSQH